jgi:membrane associated rhomboid family serine protease
VFFLVPIGVDDHEVDRLPVVSIAIAVACALAFLVTWVFPLGGSGGEPEAQEVIRRWSQQPDLVLPPAFLDRFVAPSARPQMERRAGRAAARGARRASDEEQRQLDLLAERAVAESEASWLRRFSLVPARGPWQVGWFTSMFLHFGWMHLLGNFLFFYICGPLLEDRWGRVLFPAFYLSCGVLAALAQYALEPHWNGMMAGASGAIAGCMGAFSFRHARRRVRMGYLFWFWFRIFRGTFAVSAWLWGLAWFVMQLAEYSVSGSRGGGVAVAAHLGGFVAGGAFAVALAASGVERKFVAPAVERQVGWAQHPEFFVGEEALARGDATRARQAFARVAAERPDQLDARAGLARASFELGEPGARAEVENVLGRALAGGRDLLTTTLEQLGPAAEPSRLRQAMAWRVAQALDAAGDTRSARPYYDVAARMEGLVGLKARVRALELDPVPDPAAISRVAQQGLAEPELQRRISALLKSVIPEEPPAIELPPEDTGLEFELHPSAYDAPPGVARAPPPPPRVVPVRIVGRDPTHLQVASANGVNPLPLRRILGVAVGVVPVADGRNTLLTDLVIGWGEGGSGPTVLRANLRDLGLEKLYPGVPPQSAYVQLLGEIEKSSGAKRLPSRNDGGSFPRYASAEEMTSACYGAA